MSTSQGSGIGREFHFGSLLKFAFPTILMMICSSLYVIVDGIFVSRYVGSDALAAVNIVAPVFALTMAISIMLATGGSAIIARNLGEGNKEKARQDFTLIIIATVFIGIIFTTLGVIFVEPIVKTMGASPRLLPYCKDYIIIILFFAPSFMLQLLFQTLFVTNGTPVLGMFLTVAAGIVNMVFDYIFMVPLSMGIAGAAWATGLGTLVPAIVGLLYFSSKKGSLWFSKPKMDWRTLGEACVNGSSEMISNLAYGFITFLYNISMMRLIGEDGVAAITIIQYTEFLMTSLFFGFAMGVAPIFSYNFGSQNKPQLKRLFKICVISIGVSSFGIFLAAELFGSKVVGIFSPEGTAVYNLAANGFQLFAIGFLMIGANIFASSLFTALSNGKISALLSFTRTGLICLLILVLPNFIHVTGIWLAVPIAECLAILVSALFILWKRKAYGYL